MKPSEGLALMNAANIKRQAQSRVNVNLTCGEVFDIVWDALVEDREKRPHRDLIPLMEKRVYQAIQNRRRPKR